MQESWVSGWMATWGKGGKEEGNRRNLYHTRGKTKENLNYRERILGSSHLVLHIVSILIQLDLLDIQYILN